LEERGHRLDGRRVEALTQPTFIADARLLPDLLSVCHQGTYGVRPTLGGSMNWLLYKGIGYFHAAVAERPGGK